MRRFGFAAFLALILLVGTVGIAAYDMGLSAGSAETAIADGASVIYAPATFSPFGLIIGTFLVIVLIGFIARGFAGPRRHMGPGAWGHYGGYRGHGDHETVPEPFRPMLERWHREAHGAPASAGGTTPPFGPAPQTTPPPPPASGPRP